MSRSTEPFSLKLGGPTVLSPYRTHIGRTLSDLRQSFWNKKLVEKMLQQGEDPMIYEVYEVPQEPVQGMFSIACTVLYPGRIGDEYFFTKGHFHQKEPTSEVYVGMAGQGLILMQDREGKITHLKVKPDVVAYIPPNTAHRSVNTGNERLVLLAVYPSEAGHDYGTLEAKGFAKLVIDKDGKPTITDNPQYSQRR